MQQVQFGSGGVVSAAVKAHVRRKVVVMGTGGFSPVVATHLKKQAAQAKKKVEVGSGGTSPAVKAHLAKRSS